MLEWIKGIGTLLVSLLGEQRARGARRAERSRSQLDDFYAPALAKVEQIRAIGAARVAFGNAIHGAPPHAPLEDTIRAVDHNNRVLREELLPLYREILALFNQRRGLIEPSTAALRPDLVAFLDLWNREASSETLVELEHREVARDPQERLYSDFKHHVERLRARC